MAKRKQKTTKSKKQTPLAKWSPFRYKDLKIRALMAGIAVALVGLPASWMLVNAQTPEGASVSPGASDGTGKTGTNQGAASNSKTGSASQAEAAKKAADAKAASDAAAKKAASATSTAGSTAGAAAPAPAPAPTPAPVVTPPTGLHSNITTTIFWVGEAAGPDNAGISNAESAWDGNWEAHYGGFDDPDNRNGYYPAGFTPLENPFYFALPYNDLDDNGDRKASASNCPNVGGSISWCKNAWIKITKGSKVAYAQWQDVGPLKEDDVAYVFGTATPANTWGAKAGLDVSPAVRDYLGLADVDKVSWVFVSASAVPAGPWKQIVTTSPGGW